MEGFNGEEFMVFPKLQGYTTTPVMRRAIHQHAERNTSRNAASTKLR